MLNSKLLKNALNIPKKAESPKLWDEDVDVEDNVWLNEENPVKFLLPELTNEDMKGAFLIKEEDVNIEGENGVYELFIEVYKLKDGTCFIQVGGNDGYYGLDNEAAHVKEEDVDRTIKLFKDLYKEGADYE